MLIVYQLTLEKFSGPLDLLLVMVEQEKLSVNEISLAKVAEEYIKYLKSLEDMPKAELAAFLVIASTLILIKSRSLLPSLKLSEEEMVDIKELEKRLKEYQFFKMLSQHLLRFNKAGMHLFSREAYAGMTSVFFPPKNADANLLHKLLRDVLISLPSKTELPEESIVKAVSLEEKMEELKMRMEKVLEVSFNAIRKTTEEKTEVIVSFLAMLELIKQGFILFEQKQLFANIELKKND